MIIGTVRLEEARVFRSMEGTQKIPAWPTPYTVEVYWSDGPDDADNPEPKGGWYCSGTYGHFGPCSSSQRAFDAAQDDLEERAQDDMERRAEQR